MGLPKQSSRRTIPRDSKPRIVSPTLCVCVSVDSESASGGPCASPLSAAVWKLRHTKGCSKTRTVGSCESWKKTTSDLV